DLHAQDAGMIGNRREGHRLHIETLLEEESPCLQGNVLIAHQDRYDGRLAPHDDQDQIDRSPHEALPIAFESAVDFLVLIGAENIADGAHGVEISGGHRTAEYERVGANLQEQLEFLLAADEAAETGKALGERADDQRDVIVAKGVEHGATT